LAKKASVKIFGIGEAKNNLLKVIQETIKSDEAYDLVGTQVIDQIKIKTRGRLEDYKQPSNEAATTKRRKSLINSGNAFDTRIVRPGVSNLSLSGQLLNAMYYTINKSLGVVSILLKSPRTPYKGVKGQELENLLNNNEIKDDLEQRGRKFFFISDKTLNVLENKIARLLRTKLRLYNQVRRKLKLK
jgi:hypothetical protein